jgi:uncharacterized protein YdeI (YjbR/CyaY-like superfamily)
MECLAQENHLRSKEIWLVIRKGANEPFLKMRDAVDEAICYGWIDSRTKRLDEERYLIRFTPRKSHTNWSARNLTKAKELLDQGRMTEFGIAQQPSDFLKLTIPGQGIEEWENGPPPDLERALNASADLWTKFEQLPPGRRKEFNRWVLKAKRPETRQKRITRTVELIRIGRSLTEDIMRKWSDGKS